MRQAHREKMQSSRIHILTCMCLLSSIAFAQTSTIQLSVSSTYGIAPLQLSDGPFVTQKSEDSKIDVLKFYISNITFTNESKTVLAVPNSFHLIDAENEQPYKFTIENNEKVEFDKIRFDIGIDSATNVSGAMGGDLDPTKGMYWTWQSGYINFKLEGSSKSCPTRNNEFQFHLGGYLPPYYCLQTVSLAVNNPQAINLKFDVQKFLIQVDLAKTNHIMSPNTEAVNLSKYLVNAFSLVQD